jgi:hypothetical protein
MIRTLRGILGALSLALVVAGCDLGESDVQNTQIAAQPATHELGVSSVVNAQEQFANEQPPNPNSNGSSTAWTTKPLDAGP